MKKLGVLSLARAMLLSSSRTPAGFVFRSVLKLGGAYLTAKLIEGSTKGSGMPHLERTFDFLKDVVCFVGDQSETLGTTVTKLARKKLGPHVKKLELKEKFKEFTTLRQEVVNEKNEEKEDLEEGCDDEGPDGDE